MLANPGTTEFDLRFSLFGIPVRVHPLFWLVTAILGWSGNSPQFTLIWMGCCFISILVHELGHALTARHFGYPPEIVLYSFGGLASFHPGWGYTTRRAVLILFAGPGAGFLLYAAVKCLELSLIHFRLFPEDKNQFLNVMVALQDMEYINLWWGLVNLLPVYPLDGGQISYHCFTHWRPRDGYQIAFKLSMVVAGAVAGYFLMQRSTYTGLLFAMLAFESYQALQAGQYR